ncbi:DNA-directed RNA polymerases I and III subunit RPAC2 [Impatiens glandulifera]|uniref:DNA-directed RNA polymerases I and III subunit RPAC2 n=1 Tax=Impatiens glandulifera TaxID=253017 RepID=UPI001FB122B7|nr:DNA-directed RNA polymerases I and III subunit RPAC2 [Impatiens glandulifera]XP_047333338.1 DNA-directed RNA polymerases I and III subunit RPAC2 [Impatiens glandulifera]
MEHGSLQDPSSSTFSITNEDHTLANSVRFTLNQDPRVVSCGYSMPHPSEARVNMRVQTTGDPASEVLKDACQELMLTCKHINSVFEQAVSDFKASQALKSMEIKDE